MGTSWWYSAFFHSARKETAFEAIAQHLEYYVKANEDERVTFTDEMLTDTLRAIAHNAVKVRGEQKNPDQIQTKSGMTMIKWLDEHQTHFGKFITDYPRNQGLSEKYKWLKGFAALGKGEVATVSMSVDQVNPYWHYKKPAGRR